MDELRSGADEPDYGDRPAHHVPGAGGGDVGPARQHIEPRSRTEYGAELEQRAVAAGADTESQSQSGADVSSGTEQRDSSREALRRFEPKQAGLPDISAPEAVAYIEAHLAERPWLSAVSGRSPEVQRIFAALDLGGGHAHIRHEGWVTEEMNELRVRCLEDPAQLDVIKRAAGIDGLKAGEKPHRCGSIATRIADPDAFASAVVRGVQHPDVQAALGTEFKAKWAPHQVVLPIPDVLEADGHRCCTGWQLEPVDGSIKKAQQNRDGWVQARAGNAIFGGPEPKARPIETFDGGTMTFTFGPNRARDGYEIVTMLVNPRTGEL